MTDLAATLQLKLNYKLMTSIISMKIKSRYVYGEEASENASMQKQVGM